MNLNEICKKVALNSFNVGDILHCTNNRNYLYKIIKKNLTSIDVQSLNFKTLKPEMFIERKPEMCIERNCYWTTAFYKKS